MRSTRHHHLTFRGGSHRIPAHQSFTRSHIRRPRNRMLTTHRYIEGYRSPVALIRPEQLLDQPSLAPLSISFSHMGSGVSGHCSISGIPAGSVRRTSTSSVESSDRLSVRVSSRRSRIPALRCGICATVLAALVSRSQIIRQLKRLLDGRLEMTSIPSDLFPNQPSRGLDNRFGRSQFGTVISTLHAIWIHLPD